MTLKNAGAWTASLLLLAGCATSMASSSPSGRLDRAAETKAALFESYTRAAGDLQPSFSAPADVARALDVAAAYDPRGLESGMIAYAGAAAMQDPAFVAGVRKAAGRQPGLAKRLAADPDAVLALPGARAAAGRASSALMGRATPIERVGAAATKASYTSQRQAWARAAAPDSRTRLARVKSAPSRAPGPDVARLYATAAAGGRGARGGPGPVVTRGVALAALNILGEGARARGLMTEPKSGMCLRMAKLNLHQCLASAGPSYEDIYCLGRHGLTETAQCVETAARGPARRAAG